MRTALIPNQRRIAMDNKAFGALLFFAIVIALPGHLMADFDDLEKEFFRDVAEMEKEYRDFEKWAFEEFQRDVKAMWGDFIGSTKKDWVEYSIDKKRRSKVDFEKGEVIVEVIAPKKEADRDPEKLKKKLQKEIERVLVDKGKTTDIPVPPKPDPKTPPDVKPKAPAPLSKEPILKGQCRDKEGNVVNRKNRRKFAKEVIQSKPIEKKTIKAKEGTVVKLKVKFDLVPDHIRVRAEQYRDLVRKNAKKYNISIPLAFAVMHTESYFNPKATSPVPAYGLMQLVPKSGGVDAYQYAHGKKKVPSRNYLYKPRNNIELGCAYLGLLKNRYFRNIDSHENAVYCTIASYNTGAGNLSKALVGKSRIKDAVAKANKMKPKQLYKHLEKNLPYKETRKYLVHVTERMQIYKPWDE